MREQVSLWKPYRLACNANTLMSIIKSLEYKSATLEILDHHINTSTASDNAFLQMFGVFAEFVANITKECRMVRI